MNYTTGNIFKILVLLVGLFVVIYFHNNETTEEVRELKNLNDSLILSLNWHKELIADYERFGIKSHDTIIEVLSDFWAQDEKYKRLTVKSIPVGKSKFDYALSRDIRMVVYLIRRKYYGN